MVNILIVRMREGEELRAPRYASAAATRNDRLPHSQQYFNNIIIYLITKEEHGEHVK